MLRLRAAASLLLLILLICILYDIQPARAATPGQVQTCSVSVASGAAFSACSKVGCGPAKATDMVRTIVGTAQEWEPWSTLKPTSSAVNCATGAWSTVAAIGAVLPGSPPPVSPPPVSPPPAPAPVAVHTYAITWAVAPVSYLVEHSADAGKTWDTPQKTSGLAISYTLPSNIAQCFRVTTQSPDGNSAPVSSCVPAITPVAEVIAVKAQ